MSQNPEAVLSKVPATTLVFWAIKITATTLGETAGDALSMSLGLGYAVSTVIFFALFLGALAAQMAARSFRPFLYWAVIIATTTVGTTMADFADRSLGVGYTGGSLILATLLLAVLVLWQKSTGAVSFANITSRKVEIFYWLTILLSNTLGTALGDFLADDSGLGFEGGALVFGSILIVIAGLYFKTKISRSLLFWAAFILTRPLGATLGDWLTKPYNKGGFDLSRVNSSLVLAILMIGLIIAFPQKSGHHAGKNSPKGTAPT